MQARLTPRWVKICGVDGIEREFAQRLVERFATTVFAANIHADEPLRRGAEHGRRFVTPAVRIAVLKIFCLEQRAFSRDGLDDFRLRLPDIEATKQR